MLPLEFGQSAFLCSWPEILGRAGEVRVITRSSVSAAQPTQPAAAGFAFCLWVEDRQPATTPAQTDSGHVRCCAYGCVSCHVMCIELPGAVNVGTFGAGFHALSYGPGRRDRVNQDPSMTPAVRNMQKKYVYGADHWRRRRQGREQKTLRVPRINDLEGTCSSFLQALQVQARMASGRSQVHWFPLTHPHAHAEPNMTVKSCCPMSEVEEACLGSWIPHRV